VCISPETGIVSAPPPAPTRLVCASFLYLSFCPEVLTHTVDQNSLNNRYSRVGLQELFVGGGSGIMNHES